MIAMNEDYKPRREARAVVHLSPHLVRNMPLGYGEHLVWRDIMEFAAEVRPKGWVFAGSIRYTVTQELGLCAYAASAWFVLDSPQNPTMI